MSNIIKYSLGFMLAFLMACNGPQDKVVAQSYELNKDSLNSDTLQAKIIIPSAVSNEDSLHYKTYKQLGFEQCKIYYTTTGHYIALDKHKTIATDKVTGDTIFLVAENNKYYALLKLSPYSTILQVYDSHNTMTAEKDFSNLSLSDAWDNSAITAAEVYMKGDVAAFLAPYNLKYNQNCTIRTVKKEADWIDSVSDNKQESTLDIKSTLKQDPSIILYEHLVNCKYFKHGVNSEVITPSHHYLLDYFVLPEDYCDDAHYLIRLRLCRIK